MLLTLLSPQAEAPAPAPAAAGGGGGKSKRRYLVERDGKLLVFANQRAALAELQSKATEEEVELLEVESPEVELPEVQSHEPYAPPQQIDLAAMQAWAELAGQLQAYQAAYESRHFAALLALFERLQDEDDVELLLLSL